MKLFIYEKTRYLAFVFAKLSSIVDAAILLVLYYAFFNSIISYGIIIWGGAYRRVLQDYSVIDFLNFARQALEITTIMLYH